jgi:hypothetical protein
MDLQSSVSIVIRKPDQRRIHLNCCIHAGLNAVALTGVWKRECGCGGANLSGGDFAKGTPRNWFTGPRAAGNEVDFPTMRPAAIVAVGALWQWERARGMIDPRSTNICLERARMAN